jgi:hypothetical protein
VQVHIGHYGADPRLESNGLEIQFIKVSNECRRQGIGTEIVRELAATHPSRTLVAFSEQVDEFWTSAGLAPVRPPKRTAVLSSLDHPAMIVEHPPSLTFRQAAERRNLLRHLALCRT